MKKHKRILTAVLAVLTAVCTIGITSPQAQAASDSTWYRIGIYAGTVQVGEDEFYTDFDDTTHRLYRYDNETEKDKLIMKYKATMDYPTFYTDGKRIVYHVGVEKGDIIKKKTIGKKGTKMVADLRKYATSRKQDALYQVEIYGDNLYYSKYQTNYVEIFKTYKVNLKTGKSSVACKSYRLFADVGDSYGLERNTWAGGRYLPVESKSGAVKIYDTKKKTYKTIASKNVRRIVAEGNYWYYLTCSDPYSRKSKTYKIFRKKISGAGKAKQIGIFHTNYNIDDITAFDDKHVVFYNYENDKKNELHYTYSTKKMKKERV